ncbi:MAG: DEAD/DEAH box helicase [Gemmatimonadetes bacterium]|nr:DEAD/DEAH box helicase [Gemmatimonadota bacterium]
MPTRASTTDDAVATPQGFAALDLDPRVLAELVALGYEEPTPIQQAAIPPLLAGRDVLAQAATGTGKTAAFAIPLLHHLRPDAAPRERTSALVLVPTRELAMQVAEAIYRYGKSLGASAVPIYGGAPMEGQISSLKRGADVVIATPGRALDHLRRKTLHVASVRTVVLDEADEMLDMGFADDLEAILSQTPADKQVALFSATLAPRLQAIARSHLRDPLVVTIDAAPVKPGKAAQVRQVAYMVQRAHKMAALGRILDVEQPASAIVFCRTRTEVDALTETLNGRGYHAEALHGGLSQDQRDRVMKRFRAHASELLIATDVAARGLDVSHLSHVVNFDVPAAAEAYVHRIGRTGRAGRTGVAITLAEPREHRMLRNIERVTGQPIEVASVPTVADLRARRLELVTGALREAILAGELDRWRTVVNALADEFDLVDIAAAAIKQVAAADGGEQDQTEIPAVATPRDRPRRTFEERAAHPRARHASADAGAPTSASSRHGAESGAVPSEGRRVTYPEGKPPRAVKKPRTAPSYAVAKLYVGAGRKANVRPGDLVGAIANELGVDSDAIGQIQIWDRHSIVEVPETMVDEIVAALSTTRIKGKRVLVRRDRGE